MPEYSLSTTGGRLVNAALAARMLGLAANSMRVYSLRYGIGQKLMMKNGRTLIHYGLNEYKSLTKVDLYFSHL